MVAVADFYPALKRAKALLVREKELVEHVR